MYFETTHRQRSLLKKASLLAILTAFWLEFLINICIETISILSVYIFIRLTKLYAWQAVLYIFLRLDKEHLRPKLSTIMLEFVSTLLHIISISVPACLAGSLRQ